MHGKRTWHIWPCTNVTFGYCMSDFQQITNMITLMIDHFYSPYCQTAFWYKFVSHFVLWIAVHNKHSLGESLVKLLIIELLTLHSITEQSAFYYVVYWKSIC